MAWAAAAVAAVAAVLMGIMWAQARADDSARARVQRAATSAARALTNFSYRRIDRDVKELQTIATGDFSNQIRELFSKAVKRQIREAKSHSIGRVRSVFVQSIEATDASAFAVVDETIDYGNLGEPQRHVLRLEIDLVETRAGWKVDQVTLFETPQQGLTGGLG